MDSLATYKISLEKEGVSHPTPSFPSSHPKLRTSRSLSKRHRLSPSTQRAATASSSTAHAVFYSSENHSNVRNKPVPRSFDEKSRGNNFTPPPATSRETGTNAMQNPFSSSSSIMALQRNGKAAPQSAIAAHAEPASIDQTTKSNISYSALSNTILNSTN